MDGWMHGWREMKDDWMEGGLEMDGWMDEGRNGDGK